MRRGMIWTATIVAGLATVTAAAAQQVTRVTVPAGTRILVRMVDSVDSSKQKAGYKFTANLETNLQAEDVVVAPRGTTVYGHLASASSAGRMKGSSQLTLELTDIVINGTAYPLLTSTYEVEGKGEGSKTARKVIGGVGLGALIGGIAGGGRGAGLAHSRVPQPEQRSPPPRRANSSRSPANLCWSFGWHSRRHCQWKDSRTLELQVGISDPMKSGMRFSSSSRVRVAFLGMRSWYCGTPDQG